MPQILITGASGVLGRELVSELSLSANNIRALSRNPNVQQSVTRFQGDLVNDTGLAPAFANVHTVVHCASAGAADPGNDIAAMQNLIQAARRAHVSHVVYVSIVGADHLQWFPYYGAKLKCEKILIESGLPWSIQRATQFHELVDYFLTLMVRGPFMITPAGGKLQPVEAKAVASRLAKAIQQEPSGRLRDLAGPEVRSIESLAKSQYRTRGRKKIIIPLPLPDSRFRLLRSNQLYTPECLPIGITWEQWLKEFGTTNNSYAERE